MSKIDEVKEILNTLCVALSITIGVIVVLVGSIVHRYDNGKIDLLFWSGLLISFILLMFVLLLINKIAKRTKEIKDLEKWIYQQ